MNVYASMYTLIGTCTHLHYAQGGTYQARNVNVKLGMEVTLGCTAVDNATDRNPWAALVDTKLLV